MAVNPFVLNITDINVTDKNNTKGNQNLNQNTNFYYGRVHAPDYKFNGKSGNAKIYYEVYSNQNSATRNHFNINGAESVDSINWYINNLHVNGNSGTYHQIAPYSKDGTNITNLRLKDISVMINKSPHKDQVILTPNKWLVFNKANPNANTTDFLVEFFDANTSWAGRGNKGETVDLNISTIQNNRLDN